MIMGWWKGEKKVAFKETLHALKMWSKLIFGIVLEFRITVSDLSNSFVLGFREVFCESRTLTCYIHVLQGLTDKSSTSAKKLTNPKENLPKIKNDLKHLYLCKTTALFDKLSPFVQEIWRNDYNEPEYTDHAEKEYFSEEKTNFCICHSEVQQVTPATQLLESNHGMMKGSKTQDAVMDVNTSRGQAANVELPKMFCYLAHEKNGVNMRYPKEPSKIPSGQFHLMRLADLDVDIRESPNDPDTWSVNTYRSIGKPITDDDIEADARVCVGDLDYFRQDKDAIFEANERLCIVKKLDNGTYIGNCEDCWNELGCIGTWLVCFQQKQFPVTLSSYYENMGSRHKGGKHGRGKFGGRCIPPDQVVQLSKDETPEQYYQGMTVDELQEVCGKLDIPYSGQRKEQMVKSIMK